MVASRPFLAKMPASLASVSGAKPVHPEIPMATLVPCAIAGVTASAAAQAAAKKRIMWRSVSRQKEAWFMPPRGPSEVKGRLGGFVGGPENRAQDCKRDVDRSFARAGGRQ